MMPPGHVKALVQAGTVATETPIGGDIILAGRAPTSLLDVIPIVLRDTPTYRYLRETARTNAAAVVAPGATKPTSTFTVTGTDGRLKVVAHMSEEIDKYLLEDAPNLQQFISTELVGGLRDAIQTEIITGDGTGEHFVGLNTVVGTQALAGTPTDVLSSIRAGITLLQNIGLTPAFVAMNPTNWQIVETKRNTSGNFDFGSPANLADPRIYGTTAVPVAGLDLKKIYLVAEGSVALSTDGSVRTEWNGTDKTLFSKNQLVARTEGRFNLDVIQPAGVVIITFASNPS